MSANLDKEYDDIVAFINDYLSFPSRIMQQVYSKSPLRFYIFSQKNFGRSLKVIYGTDYFRGKLTPAYREMMDQISTQEFKAHPFYQILTSEYPLDELSEAVRKKFKEVDFEKVLKNHERKGVALSEPGMNEALGFILAGFTLILRTVPKQIIEETFQIPFDVFEVNMFWALLFFLGYAIVIFLPFWFKTVRGKATYNRIGTILKYFAIKYS